MTTPDAWTSGPLNRRSAVAVVTLAVEVAIVLAIALGVRVAFDRPTAHFDEFYHVLAARAYLETGQPYIADATAPYARGMIYTQLVAATFVMLGESIFAARLPSMVFGALLVAAVYVWLRTNTAPLAAVLGAAMLALCPEALNYSVFSRFYMLHALLVFLASMCVFVLVERSCGGSSRASTWVVAGVLLTLTAVLTWLAMQLQSTTLIAALIVGVWTVCVIVWRLECGARMGAPGMWVATVAAGAMVGAAALWASGHLAEIRHEYRLVALWAMDSRDDEGYYLRHLWQWYRPLVALSPLLAVLALRRWPRAASFALVICSAGLLLHSFAGFKAMRYAFWTMPYLMALWGMGLAEAMRLLHVAATSLGQRRLRLPRPTITAAFVVACMLAMAYGSHRTYAYYLARGLVLGEERNSPFTFPDWQAAVPTLAPIAANVDALVTSASVKAIYYLDDADAVISVTGRGRGEEGAVDWRTGIPVFAEPESMQEIIEEHDSGLIVVEQEHWREQWYVPDDVADVIEERTVRVPLPKDIRLLAFRWDALAMKTTAQ